MAESDSEEPLSPGEEEMMQLFLAGEYSEDAKRLCVSEKTVRAQAPILWRDGSGDARRDTEQGASAPEPSLAIATQ